MSRNRYAGGTLRESNRIRNAHAFRERDDKCAVEHVAGCHAIHGLYLRMPGVFGLRSISSSMTLPTSVRGTFWTTRQLGDVGS